MGLSRLSQKCRACPYKDSCSHKEMEALAYLKSAGLESGKDAAMPPMIKHDYRDIKLAENTTITIDVEVLKRNINDSINQRFMMYGA